MVPHNHPERSVNGHVPQALEDTTDFTAWKAQQPQPSWRDREPRHVHSMKWTDADGIEHLYVLRSDDVDDVLREMQTLKLYIKMAKDKAARARAAKDTPPTLNQPPSPPVPAHHNVQARESLGPESADKGFCAAHNVWMKEHTKGESR